MVRRGISCGTGQKGPREKIKREFSNFEHPPCEQTLAAVLKTIEADGTHPACFGAVEVETSPADRSAVSGRALPGRSARGKKRRGSRTRGHPWPRKQRHGVGDRANDARTAAAAAAISDAARSLGPAGAKTATLRAEEAESCGPIATAAWTETAHARTLPGWIRLVDKRGGPHHCGGHGAASHPTPSTRSDTQPRKSTPMQFIEKNGGCVVGA